MKTQNETSTVITESTAVKSNPETKKTGMSPFWQSVLVGGVPGILIGAGGMVSVEALASSSSDNDSADTLQEDGSLEAAAGIQEAHNVTDDMSFSEAFAAARSEVGPGGAFVWHGQVYDTYRSDDPEWQEMSDEDRAAHSREILSQVHPEPYTPTDDEPEIVPVDGDEIDDVSAVADMPEDETDVDVHILGVGTVGLSEGSEAQIGVGLVDNHTAIFADTDGDNVVDTVLIDSNDNGDIDSGELYDAREAGITIDDLREEVDTSFMESMDGASDIPDAPDASLLV